MIREDRFLISRRLYAVDLSSMTVGAPSALGWCSVRINAAWFRRRRGVTVACVGNLRESLRPAPKTAAEFVERAADGRWGGHCEGRWDGENYWGAQKPDVIEQHLALLKPMLANYPNIPAGFDGWWRF
jgi:hypothetical protein